MPVAKFPEWFKPVPGFRFKDSDGDLCVYMGYGMCEHGRSKEDPEPGYIYAAILDIDEPNCTTEIILTKMDQLTDWGKRRITVEEFLSTCSPALTRVNDENCKRNLRL